MLPDMPDIKQTLFQAQQDFIRSSAKQEMGVFSDCRSYPCFEGNQMGIERANGEREKNDFSVSHGIGEFKPQEEDLASNFEKLQAMGKQIAEMFQKQAFATLDKSLEQAGQTVKGKGGLTPETIMAIFEKIQIPLGDDGKLDLSGMRFTGGQAACDDYVRSMQEIAADPEKRKKLAELQARKEAEARAREADRKLVG